MDTSKRCKLATLFLGKHSSCSNRIGRDFLSADFVNIPLLPLRYDAVLRVRLTSKQFDFLKEYTVRSDTEYVSSYVNFESSHLVAR